MTYTITIMLKRDKLEDDFKVCNQKIVCPIPITTQILSFIENIVNANIKSEELFIIKAPCILNVYTSYTYPYATFKKEIELNSLLTYNEDKIEIKPATKIF